VAICLAIIAPIDAEVSERFTGQNFVCKGQTTRDYVGEQISWQIRKLNSGYWHRTVGSAVIESMYMTVLTCDMSELFR